MIKGIDISSYQPSVYSTRGLDFVITKITEGTSYTNPKWVRQRQTARDAGLVTGFYHFVRPGSMTAQANYFLSKINLLAGDILVLDWEDPRVSSADKDAWIRHVQAKAPGHRVLLYCNVDYWINRDTSSFAGDGLWIAQYNGRPGRPSIQAPWLIHQYTSDPIDTNLAQFDDRAAMRAWAMGDSSKEDGVQLDDRLAIGDWLKNRFPDEEGLQDGEIYVKTALASGYGWSRIAADNSAQVLAQLGAQQATIDKLVDALGQKGGLTAAEIKGAAEAGAQAALDRLGDALTKED
ncbi:glycoside hydrolase family 25 protein [Streptomyces sp. B15]|uniref:glycoside hydrolase family 25 protein n=1 Tax=Streptomyces sp. B15 TaxID=1537797 RepID=UPI001B376726|nr:glycoside hydrolase family 25 protein [Streptomyces sp. B15]MBQ1122655.1 glycoside hydrolase family 25 protein [Streptomyces sp. B15]